MPIEKENKYQKGKIYVIRLKETNDLLYVGSTIKTIRVRFINHKAHSKVKPLRVYKFINSLSGKWDDVEMKLYKSFPCTSRTELFQEEGKVIRSLKPKYNFRVEGRSIAQYRKDHKDKIAMKVKAYYEAHKAKIDQYQKEYTLQRVNCECGMKGISKRNISTHLKTNRHNRRMNRREK